MQDAVNGIFMQKAKRGSKKKFVKSRRAVMLE